ncbi:hypothetical protein U2G91_21060 [Rhodococcoides fascians]|uniref:hypothetical protein n=1 Tax=Rhodococcoides fascians TaxID=1828 RepID=UPI002ACD36AD|nr:hypothetical protein [Rhodococcus fascians]WQH27529.1 hypothetical protein U2G91_21060 [Rhodococcus fascians]
MNYGNSQKWDDWLYACLTMAQDQSEQGNLDAAVATLGKAINLNKAQGSEATTQLVYSHYCLMMNEKVLQFSPDGAKQAVQLLSSSQKHAYSSPLSISICDFGLGLLAVRAKNNRDAMAFFGRATATLSANGHKFKPFAMRAIIELMHLVPAGLTGHLATAFDAYSDDELLQLTSLIPGPRAAMVAARYAHELYVQNDFVRAAPLARTTLAPLRNAARSDLLEHQPLSAVVHTLVSALITSAWVKPHRALVPSSMTDSKRLLDEATEILRLQYHAASIRRLDKMSVYVEDRLRWVTQIQEKHLVKFAKSYIYETALDSLIDEYMPSAEGFLERSLLGQLES